MAPPYHWDDYAGTDVHSKTVVLLSGDPPVADPHDPTKLDETMFLGRALTLYGRTGTKLETAFAQRASPVILVTATPEATPTLFGNCTRETVILRGPHERDRVQAAALLTGNAATKLFAAAGQDYNSRKADATKPGFHAVDLSVAADFTVSNRVRRVDSANDVARITGSDPERSRKSLCTAPTGTITAAWETTSSTARVTTQLERQGSLNWRARSRRCNRLPAERSSSLADSRGEGSPWGSILRGASPVPAP